MAYVHCMPARIISLKHGLDNIVTGQIETCHGNKSFTTRGHIVKATNKVYRVCQWKPSAGQNVLIDAEITGDHVLVDHIEIDYSPDVLEVSDSQYLNMIAQMLPKHPPASKTVRLWRTSEPYRIRFALPASRQITPRTIQEEIVHAVYDKGLWKIWTVKRDGGHLATKGIDQAVMPIIARAAGCELLSGETEKEAFERKEREEIAASKASRIEIAAPSPVLEDCPF